MKRLRLRHRSAGAHRDPIARRQYAYASQRRWREMGPRAAEYTEGRADHAVLSGDPSKDGLYVLRLKMPANYKIAAHYHPTTEYVTVISRCVPYRNGRQAGSE